jgi:LysM repeat protein
MSSKVLAIFLFAFFLYSTAAKAATESVRDSLGTERKGGSLLVLHKVEAGETLMALARRYRSSLKAIQEENPHLSAGVKVGEVVKVPYPAEAKPASAGRKTHTVTGGQGLFSIARTYNVSVADLRAWNGLTSDNLSEGQVLFISAGKGGSSTAAEGATAEPVTPITETANAAQPVVKDKSEQPAARRKTHKVGRGEGLSTISQKYKVSTKDLRKWNRLSSSKIHVGQVLIVSPPKKQSAAQEEAPSATEVGEISARQTVSVNNDPRRKSDTRSSVKDGENADPAGLQARGDAEARSGREEPGRRENRVGSGDVVIASTSSVSRVTEAGLAESINDSGNTEGYYALHRTAPVGTILQVRNEMNNMSVFVKVVGKLPDTGANDKLVVKITQKAYERLAAIDRRFRVEVTYLPH